MQRDWGLFVVASLALVGVVGEAAQLPQWSVRMEAVSDWWGSRELAVDSNGKVVARASGLGGAMRQCSTLDRAVLARIGERVDWLTKNTQNDGQWSGGCLDGMQVSLRLRSGEREIMLGYPSCGVSDVEVPTALRQLAGELREIRGWSDHCE